jgi:hypothetical protein
MIKVEIANIQDRAGSTPPRKRPRNIERVIVKMYHGVGPGMQHPEVMKQAGIRGHTDLP